jgi:phosphinothricin acetyltransferase
VAVGKFTELLPPGKPVIMEPVTIRKMETGDWEEVKNIYEAGIATGLATFEVAAPGWEQWDKGHLSFARLVAVYKETVVGWAALSAVSSRCVYGGVAEVSVYISDDHRGKGIGKALLQALITESEANGIWTLQAGIFTDNTASIKLHEGVGFRLIGYREKIGKLKDQWKDNFILERRSKVVGID